MKYNVGQVIHVVFAKQATIIPCLVVEENIKKTLDGQKTEYKVIFAVEPDVIVDLSKVDGKDGKVFVTLDEASQYLGKKFAAYVELQRNKAIKMAAIWQKQVKRAEIVPQDSEAMSNGEYVIATLPDGTEARVRLPNMQQVQTEISDEKVQ